MYRRGRESVVMAGTNVARLSPLATLVVDQLTDWRTSAELADELVRHFGEPDGEDPIELVDAALLQLADLAIVQVDHE